MSDDSRDEWDVIILGGGASGLGLAHRLGELGVAAVVLEARGRPGGLAGSFSRNGYTLDYGPHNIHCRDAAGVAVFRSLLGEDLVSHSPRAKILFRDRLVDYPLRGLRALTVLDPFTAAVCAAGFVGTRLTGRRGTKGDDNYRDWIVSRFGKGLYDVYFGPYSEKVWGVDPSALSAVIAEKRIPTPSLSRLLREAVLCGKSAYHPEHPDHVLSFYPRHGIGQLVNVLVESIRSSGGNVLLGSRVTRVTGQRTRGYEVEFRRGRNVGRLRARTVCSTLALSDLARGLDPPPPAEAAAAAKELRYRSLVLLYLLVDRPRVLPSPWVYFSDVRVPFNRVYEVGQFSDAVVPAGKTALCFELSCWRGDPEWRQTGRALSEAAQRLLARYWPEASHDVTCAFTKRFETVYPVFDVGYEDRLAVFLRHLGERGGLISFGRQGLFTYVNVDHCLDMGFELAEVIARGHERGPSTLFAAYRPPGTFDRLMDGA